ncbi:hypothetical protein TWF694_003766 [Orbilia ellipsospora]|uniref:C2H2-type domain-containing protein n=1 Tax=Orbilia ellipsospora TaxID=2528407 RepID=A0AAV9X004_9PEZI
MFVITIEVLLNPDLPDQLEISDTKSLPILPKDETEEKFLRDARKPNRIKSEGYDAILEIKSECSESVTKIPLRRLYYEELTKPTSRRLQTPFLNDKIPNSVSSFEFRNPPISTISCIENEIPGPSQRNLRFQRLLAKPSETRNTTPSTSLPASPAPTPRPYNTPLTTIQLSQRDQRIETPKFCSPQPYGRKRRKWWPCEISSCRKIFTNRREYEKHLSKVHKHKSTQCEICGGKLGRKDYMRDHVRSKRHTRALAKVQARNGK